MRSKVTQTPRVGSGNRGLLGGLLVIMALNAFGGGWYGMAGARGVPVEWLAGSPFRSYFLPSLFLFVGIGGSCATAAWAVLARRRSAGTLAGATGLLLLAWIAAQVAFIGYVSWLQPAVAACGLIILVLARQLPRIHA